MTRTRKSYRYYRARKQMILVIAALALAFGMILIGGNLLRSNQVQASGAYDKEICYKSVEIQKGDTLWSIADEYMNDSFESRQDYIDTVKEINHLGKDDIQIGSYIMVPYSVDVLK